VKRLDRLCSAWIRDHRQWRLVGHRLPRFVAHETEIVRYCMRTFRGCRRRFRRDDTWERYRA
jgi:hypothetical protein